MAFKISKATKKTARLRLAIIGPSGSGKTYTALAIAQGLGARVMVIDTERGSASKYADRYSFEVGELDTFAPATYVEAIRACEQAGADVIVIDSLSHAWMGAGGALEMVDRAARQSNSRNSFDAWRSVTPHHNALVEAMLQCRAHLIVTMRSKTEYVLEEDSRGKKVPRKVGMAPVQRDGLEYEFDVVAEMSADHVACVTKSRCSDLADAVVEKPGAQMAQTLRAWLTDGTPATVPAPSQTDPRALGPMGIDAPRTERGRDHVREATASVGGENPTLGEHNVAVREAVDAERQVDEVPAWQRALEALAESTPVLAPYCNAVERAALPGDCVAVWMRHRADLAAMPAHDREAAWKALGLRCEHVGAMKNAKVWLKKSIAETDAARAVAPVSSETGAA